MAPKPIIVEESNADVFPEFEHLSSPRPRTDSAHSHPSRNDTSQPTKQPSMHWANNIPTSVSRHSTPGCPLAEANRRFSPERPANGFRRLVEDESSSECYYYSPESYPSPDGVDSIGRLAEYMARQSVRLDYNRSDADSDSVPSMLYPSPVPATKAGTPYPHLLAPRRHIDKDPASSYAKGASGLDGNIQGILSRNTTPADTDVLAFHNVPGANRTSYPHRVSIATRDYSDSELIRHEPTSSKRPSIHTTQARSLAHTWGPSSSAPQYQHVIEEALNDEVRRTSSDRRTPILFNAPSYPVLNSETAMSQARFIRLTEGKNKARVQESGSDLTYSTSQQTQRSQEFQIQEEDEAEILDAVYAEIVPMSAVRTRSIQRKQGFHPLIEEDQRDNPEHLNLYANSSFSYLSPDYALSPAPPSPVTYIHSDSTRGNPLYQVFPMSGGLPAARESRFSEHFEYDGPAMYSSYPSIPVTDPHYHRRGPSKRRRISMRIKEKRRAGYDGSESDDGSGEGMCKKWERELEKAWKKVVGLRECVCARITSMCAKSHNAGKGYIEY